MTVKPIRWRDDSGGRPARSAGLQRSAAGRAPRAVRSRAALVLLAVLLAVVALGGGSDRADVASLIFVRPAAIALLLAFVIVGHGRLEGERTAAALALAFVAIPLVQLIPLPPAIWTALPGREPFVRASAGLGLDSVWRPISLTPAATLNSLFATFVPAAMLIGAWQLDRSELEKLVVAVMALIVASGLLAMLQAAQGPASFLRPYRITNVESGVGLFANRNHQALFMLLGFPILAHLSRRYGDRYGRQKVWPAAAALALFLAATVWTAGSRAGLLLLPLALILSVLLWQNGFGARTRKIGLGVIGLLGLAFVILAALGLGQSSSLDRLVSLDPFDDLRFVLLKDFWRMLLSFFPVGSGFGSFPDVYRAFERIDVLGPKYINHAHDDVLEIVIEGGLPVLILSLAFLGWWGRRLWSIVWRENRRTEQAGATDGALAALGAACTGLAMIACVVDYPLRTPLMAVVFTFFLVCMAARPARLNG